MDFAKFFTWDYGCLAKEIDTINLVEFKFYPEVLKQSHYVIMPLYLEHREQTGGQTGVLLLPALLLPVLHLLRPEQGHHQHSDLQEHPGAALALPPAQELWRNEKHKQQHEETFRCVFLLQKELNNSAELTQVIRVLFLT